MSRYTDDSNYYSDRRVRAGERGSLFQHVDDSRMKAIVLLYNEDEEEEIEVPITFEVCPTCHGKGSHVNPSVDAGGLTREDFAEDPDFAEAYCEGCYDVSCYGCGGQRVVAEIDRDRCDPEVLKRIDDREEAERQYRAEVEAERRMGC